MTTPTAGRRALSEPWVAAAWMARVIVVFGALGILQREATFPGSGLFDLDAEWVPPALWSAALDAAAAAGYALLIRRRLVHPVGAFLAALFGLMSLDEWFGVHERLEYATGVDWQTLYAPLVFAAGIGTLVVLRAWGRRHIAATLLLCGGGTLWFLAQVLEHLQWAGPHGDVKVAHYVAMMIPEELGEMCGSALFLLSALVVLKAARCPAGGA